MSNKKTDGTSEVEVSQDVDRIRDIIFGGQMREYEQKFQVVQRDFGRLQQEFDRLAEQISDEGSSQNKKFQDLRREVRQADDDLRNELRQTTDKLIAEKVDRLALGELFIELGTQLKSGGSLVDLLQGLNIKAE